ncbi:MAG: hypothetical protein K2Y27_07250 [Xanthobacteraceae bacterium]|nr:hypothetical protein [Xanthobacteraceae bacterium]
MPSSETENEPSKSDEAQKSDEIASGPQSAAQKSNLVFDFLYHDHRRIASFLAQFETYGVLQQVKALEYTSESDTTKTGLTTNFSAGVARTGTTQDVTTGSEERDSAERTYDPLWTNARTFLNYLAERNLIVDDPKQARIGQFVLVSGTLAAFDMGLLKEAWKLPALKEVAIRNANEQAAASNTATLSSRAARKAAKYEQKNKSISDTEFGLEMMKIMPHTIQAAIKAADDVSVWSSLREDSLVIPGSELLLKHGVAIAGTWQMLGILDALPDPPGDVATQSVMLDHLLASMSLGMMAGQVVGSLAPMARMLIGRPATAYGMTPLMIFRGVSA